MGNELKDSLDAVLEAAELWDSLQDDEPKVAEEIKEAREELDSALESLDVASLCVLIHGKQSHK
jgi:hypothetical protein